MRRHRILVALTALASLALPASATAATDSEILLARPLVPTQISLMHPHWYPDGPPASPAPGIPPSQAQVAQMLDSYLLAEFPSNPAARSKAKSVYQSSAAEQKVPSPSLRAALATLTGTIGEPAIDYILHAKTPSGDPKVSRVIFASLSSDLIIAQTPTNPSTGQSEIRFNVRNQADNPFRFTSLMAHEPLHQDNENGSTYEESAATAIDTLIYLRQIARHPELARGDPTMLSRLENTIALSHFNTGIGSQLGVFASNRNQRVLPGSNTDYRSFWDAFDKQLFDTTGGQLLGAYLKRIHRPGAPICSAQKFDNALIHCIDKQGNAGLTSAELVKAAKALKLDANVERHRSLSISYAHSNFTGKLSSQQKPCTRSQSVAVYRQKSGADAKVGSDKTNSSGAYSVHKRNASGRFYAKAPRSTVVGTGVCLAAQSSNKRVG